MFFTIGSHGILWIANLSAPYVFNFDTADIKCFTIILLYDP